MKNIITAILLIITVHFFAQVKTSFVQPLAVELAINKTTNLVFPFTITHVDRGQPGCIGTAGQRSRQCAGVKSGG